MATKLSQKSCVPCRGGIPPLAEDQLRRLSDELEGDWQVVDEHHLEREYTFRDFRGALDFTLRLGEIAEEEAHHPDILLAWGKVGVKIYTHKIGGLSESDFILAAKYEEAWKDEQDKPGQPR